MAAAAASWVPPCACGLVWRLRFADGQDGFVASYISARSPYVCCGCAVGVYHGEHGVIRPKGFELDGQNQAEQKVRCRQRLLEQRESFIESGDVDQAGVALSMHILDVLSDKHVTSIVAAYLPMRGEPDPVPAVVQSGLSLALPVVVENGQPLVFRQWKLGDSLEAGSWGTRHPVPSLPEVIPDFLLVPLVGFSADGRRLGHGQGFYDRTLAMWAEHGVVPCAFGVAWECQRAEDIPVNLHDVPLDGIVTDKAIYVCS